MKKLYFIEKEKFLGQSIEKLCKQSGHDCYFTDTGEDSSYIITDMAPDLLLIDFDTVSKYQDELAATLNEEALSQIPVVLINSRSGDTSGELVKRAVKFLDKPLKVETLISELFSLVGENNG